jgi:hypothetical protein
MSAKKLLCAALSLLFLLGQTPALSQPVPVDLSSADRSLPSPIEQPTAIMVGGAPRMVTE